MYFYFQAVRCSDSPMSMWIDRFSSSDRPCDRWDVKRLSAVDFVDLVGEPGLRSFVQLDGSMVTVVRGFRVSRTFVK